MSPLSPEKGRDKVKKLMDSFSIKMQELKNSEQEEGEQKKEDK